MLMLTTHTTTKEMFREILLKKNWRNLNKVCCFYPKGGVGAGKKG